MASVMSVCWRGGSFSICFHTANDLQAGPSEVFFDLGLQQSSVLTSNASEAHGHLRGQRKAVCLVVGNERLNDAELCGEFYLSKAALLAEAGEALADGLSCWSCRSA